MAVALGFRPFDDTFITFRYALNLVRGQGFVYNAGERVLGTTTPLWALLLAGFRSLGAIPSVAFGLALLADGLSALLILRLLGRLGFPWRPVDLEMVDSLVERPRRAKMPQNIRISPL